MKKKTVEDLPKNKQKNNLAIIIFIIKFNEKYKIVFYDIKLILPRQTIKIMLMVGTQFYHITKYFQKNCY